MKAIYLKEPWKIGIKEIPQRPLREGEALIQIKAAGICGSDIGAFRGSNGLVSYPRVIGHELAGVVLSLPENAPTDLNVGDRVVIDPYIFCGSCYPCSLGRTNCCTDLKVLGVQTEGGMTETLAHPASMLIKAPDQIPWEILPLAEPLTIALHCLHRLKIKAGEHIAILGAGPIGLLAAMTALHYGALPIVIDPVRERLELALSLGAEHIIDPVNEDVVERIKLFTDGRMAETVLEASGANSAIRSCLDIVSHAGRIALTGWPKKETMLPTDMITKKEVDILGARTSAGEFQEALELIESGKVNVGRILTKVISPEEAPEAIRLIEKNPQDYLKVNVLF